MPDPSQLSDFRIGDIITADGLGDDCFGLVYHIGRLEINDKEKTTTDDALWAIWDKSIDALIEKSLRLDGKKIHGLDHFAYADTEKMWYMSVSSHNHDPIRILGHIEVTHDVRVDRFEQIISSEVRHDCNHNV